MLPLHTQEDFAWHVKPRWCNSFNHIVYLSLPCFVVLLMTMILFFTIYVLQINVKLVLLKYIIWCSMRKKGHWIIVWSTDAFVTWKNHFCGIIDLGLSLWIAMVDVVPLRAISVPSLRDVKLIRVTGIHLTSPPKQDSLLCKIGSHVMSVNMRAMLPLAHVLSLFSSLLFSSALFLSLLPWHTPPFFLFHLSLLCCLSFGQASARVDVNEAESFFSYF